MSERRKEEGCKRRGVVVDGELNELLFFFILNSFIIYLHGFYVLCIKLEKKKKHRDFIARL
jgi:hypothetical protein